MLRCGAYDSGLPSGRSPLSVMSEVVVPARRSPELSWYSGEFHDEITATLREDGKEGVGVTSERPGIVDREVRGCRRARG